MESMASSWRSTGKAVHIDMSSSNMFGHSWLRILADKGKVSDTAGETMSRGAYNNKYKHPTNNNT